MELLLFLIKTILSFLDFFVSNKISKISFKPYNFWNFESAAINDLDCIMTLEVFENFLLQAGWLCGFVTGLWSGTGVQISLEPNFFFLILIIFFKWKLFSTLLWYSKPILYYSLFKCLLGNNLCLNMYCVYAKSVYMIWGKGGHF
jgi:hypothetical protein